MATDSKDINLEMASGVAIQQPAEEQGAAGDVKTAQQGAAGDVKTAQEDPPLSPAAVPTVSEKVPEERVDGKKARVPRRILHFSDGTMEEYSTDDEDETDRPPDALAELREADTKSMSWMPWAWYWFKFAGYSTLSKVDVVGEKLAYMLGITSPKYQYELDEYYEMKKKEEEEKHQRDLESAGWTPNSALNAGSTNPAAYLADADQSTPGSAPPDQSAAEVVSGQPVAAETRP